MGNFYGNDEPAGLFAGKPADSSFEEKISLPLMRTSEHVVQDYAATSLSLKAHPVHFVREKLEQLHILTDRCIYKHDGMETW